MEDYIISSEYDGKPRKLFKCQCDFCQKDVWKPKHQINDKNFCSRECYFSFKENDAVGSWTEVNCAQCEKLVKKYIRHITANKTGIFFCSRECQKLFYKTEDRYCNNCNSILNDSQTKFCSITCQWDYQYKENIEKWKQGILLGYNLAEGMCSWLRKFIFEKFDSKCCQCGWAQINPATGKIPLQVDHIDGDYKNNKEENLRLLCPNCHSLTPTFGSLNKGKGREKRRLKLQGNSLT